MAYIETLIGNIAPPMHCNKVTHTLYLHDMHLVQYTMETVGYK